MSEGSSPSGTPRNTGEFLNTTVGKVEYWYTGSTCPDGTVSVLEIIKVT
jgi:hypothetical protein